MATVIQSLLAFLFVRTSVCCSVDGDSSAGLCNTSPWKSPSPDRCSFRSSSSHFRPRSRSQTRTRASSPPPWKGRSRTPEFSRTSGFARSTFSKPPPRQFHRHSESPHFVPSPMSAPPLNDSQPSVARSRATQRTYPAYRAQRRQVTSQQKSPSPGRRIANMYGSVAVDRAKRMSPNRRRLQPFANQQNAVKPLDNEAISALLNRPALRARYAFKPWIQR